MRRRRFVASRRRFVQGSIAVAATLPALPRRARAAGTLNIYNWDSYIGENTLAQFSEATGTEVRYDLYASNDELFAKLREGNPGYDLIVPSNSFVSRMIQADMLTPLDHAQLANLGNIMPRFADSRYDPGMQYSVPYFWGTTGVGYRASSIDRPESWNVLFDPTILPGRKSLLNDVIIIQTAAKFLGYSLNPTEPAEIDAAVELLIKAKPGLHSFAPDTGQDLLISGEVEAAMDYNGDILQVMEEDDDLSYVMPQEGGELWVDAMAIPKGAPNVANALAFVNFILVPEVAAEIAEEIYYATPNEAAKALLPQEMLDNPALFPPDDVIDRCEPTIFHSEEVEDLYAKGLTRVFAA